MMRFVYSAAIFGGLALLIAAATTTTTKPVIPGQVVGNINVGVVQTNLTPSVATTKPTTIPTTQTTVPIPVMIPWATTKTLLAAAPGTNGWVTLPAGNYEIQAKTVLTYSHYDFSKAHFYATVHGLTSGMFQDVAGASTTVKGGIYDSIWPRLLSKGQNPKVSVQAFLLSGTGSVLDHPTFMNIDTGWQIAPGAKYLAVLYPHATADIRGDMVYTGGGNELLPRGWMVVVGAQSDDSEQEHGVRDSTPGFTDGYWCDCNFTCTNNKEPLALRQPRNQNFYDCLINSTMGVYVGEGMAVPVGQEPAFLDFENCTLHGGGFWNLRYNAHDIMIRGGSIDIHAEANPSLAPRVIGLGDIPNSMPYNITFQGINRYLYQPLTGAQYDKPWFSNLSASPDTKAIKDGGSNETIQVVQGTSSGN